MSPSVEDKLSRADVVFRGTISEERNGTLVFRVSRVWKGSVGTAFRMPAIREGSACIGFWPNLLKVGNELLVYANDFGHTKTYTTDICGKHMLMKDAAKDLAALGPGREPRK
jgi:hypothetical protein